MMNDVIDKLAEIEAAAVKITENANEQKAKIAQDSEKRQADYDKELQASIDSRIQEMKAENAKKMEAEIARIREENDKETMQLEEEYKRSHATLAKSIVDRLTGV